MSDIKVESEMKVEHINKVSSSGYPHDKVYSVITMNARMKDPSNGKWVDAVAYEEGGRLFVREKENFLGEFRVIED